MSSNSNFIQRTQCPGCRGTQFHLLREARYDAPPLREYLDEFYRDVGSVEHAALAGAMYSLQTCEACGLVFQRDIPNGKLSAKLYEEWMDPHKVFDLYERGHGVNFYSPLARQVETVIRHFGGKPAELKVLDLGMGWGRWCMFASAYGCETYGLEISPARIAFARAHGIRVLDYDELAAHQFNMINAEQVFEHLPDPLETLTMLRPRLRPGGLIWIAVPDGADIRRRIERWDWQAPKGAPDSLNAVAPLEHLNCFTPDALMTMAAKAGFGPAEIRLPRRKKQEPWWKRWMGGGGAAMGDPGTECFFTPKD